MSPALSLPSFVRLEGLPLETWTARTRLLGNAIVAVAYTSYTSCWRRGVMDAITTRFPRWLQQTVERVAPGQGRSDAVRQLVIEAATEREFPMITWRDGPSGRRPGLRTGPDVEEVVAAAYLHHPDPDASGVAAEIGVAESAVVDALRFAAAYPAIVDARLELRERAVAAGPAE